MYHLFTFSHGKRGVILMLWFTLEVINKSSIWAISHFHLMCHLFEYSRFEPTNVSFLSSSQVNIQTRSTLASRLVSYPDPPPKRKGGSGEYSTALHHGLALPNAKLLKLLAGLQQIGGVLIRSVKVWWIKLSVYGKEAQYRWDNCHISQSDCAAEIPRRYKMLYYIHQIPLSWWSGLGTKLPQAANTSINTSCTPFTKSLRSGHGWQKPFKQ